MSFYGNVNKNNLVFDKIYQNKATMDALAKNDGVFIGRYVLVDYHKDGTDYIQNSKQDGENSYDSTVWQKVYSNGEEKYRMIAELNFDTPEFNLVIDPPTLNVKDPYKGDETIDRVSYYWHFQPQWGFQIKPQDNKDFSDEEVSLVGKVWNYEEQKFEDIMENKYYQGDIYYNKEGFNPEYRIEKEYNLIDDTIKLTPTGCSGNTYGGDEEVADTYELSIILPSIGNTISSLWDIVYGPGEEEIEGSNKYIRNMDINWNSTLGNRLVKGSEDNNGYIYNPYYIVNINNQSEKQYEINTLAGCINSVHDLIGMIIEYEDPSKYNNFNTFKEEVLKKASTNRIYYGPYGENSNYNGFYMKYLSYDYLDDYEQDVEVYLTEFTSDTYYYKNNNNFYKEYKKNNHGSTYYILKNIKEEIFNENKYDPNVYYYKDGQDYVLDGSLIPDSNKIYYKINIDKADSVNNKTTFFFPTSQEYFDKFFKGQETEKQGTGLFYEDPEHKGIYRHFVLGETQFNENLKFYWIENYVIEDSIDKNGNIVTVYDFDKKSVKTLYTFIPFDSNINNHYYYDNVNKRYNKLTSENEIEKDVIYYIFNEEVVEEIVEKFYQPDSGYYYKENENYILAKENKKQNKTYYSFEYEEIKNVIFYEENKYYYRENNIWILDENKIMTSGRQYYKRYPLYVKSDTENIFPIGSLWNDNLDQEDFPSVILGRKVEKYKWKELVGFSRDLNTLNGLLLEVNNVLKIGDKDTRDTETVQGCINNINDIIGKITKLSPSKILITDKYGRISEAKIETDGLIDLQVSNGVINISLSEELKRRINLLETINGLD